MLNNKVYKLIEIKERNLGCDFCSTFSKSGIEIKIEL